MWLGPLAPSCHRSPTKYVHKADLASDLEASSFVLLPASCKSQYSPTCVSHMQWLSRLFRALNRKSGPQVIPEHHTTVSSSLPVSSEKFPELQEYQVIMVFWVSGWNFGLGPVADGGSGCSYCHGLGRLHRCSQVSPGLLGHMWLLLFLKCSVLGRRRGQQL